MWSVHSDDDKNVPDTIADQWSSVQLCRPRQRVIGDDKWGERNVLGREEREREREPLSRAVVAFDSMHVIRDSNVDCHEAMMTASHSAPGSHVATPLLPQWRKIVVWTDVAVLGLAALASVPGLFRMLGTGNGLGTIAGALLVSKIAVGLLADSRLLSQRPRGLQLACVAALIAVIGSLFTWMFVDVGAGAHPSSWAFRNRSGLHVVLVVWGLAWNLLYVVAARTLTCRPEHAGLQSAMVAARLRRGP